MSLVRITRQLPSDVYLRAPTMLPGAFASERAIRITNGIWSDLQTSLLPIDIVLLGNVPSTVSATRRYPLQLFCFIRYTGKISTRVLRRLLKHLAVISVPDEIFTGWHWQTDKAVPGSAWHCVIRLLAPNPAGHLNWPAIRLDKNVFIAYWLVDSWNLNQIFFPRYEDVSINLPSQATKPEATFRWLEEIRYLSEAEIMRPCVSICSGRVNVYLYWNFQFLPKSSCHFKSLFLSSYMTCSFIRLR